MRIAARRIAEGTDFAQYASHQKQRQSPMAGLPTLGNRLKIVGREEVLLTQQLKAISTPLLTDSDAPDDGVP
jgi:hypothetical protein